METLKKRNDKLAFYGIVSTNGVTYKRMTGFTEMSISKNPKEYTRQYVDENFEQSDVVGYSPSIAFTLDFYLNNDIHSDITLIANEELIGSDAIREIVIVDIKDGDNSDGYSAIKREFAVIVDSEGNGNDAYQLSGTLKSKSNKIIGYAKTTDDWQSCTFSVNESDEITL